MYHIYDKVDNAQKFDLGKLFRLVRGSREDTKWKVERAFGYGDEVCAIEDALEQLGNVEMAASELIRIAEEDSQWFYEVRCRDEDNTMGFGLIDSGRMYVSGESSRVAAIASAFERVEFVA